MTNLKKTIAVVLALAMIFSMGMITFAYSDVDADTTVGEAVGILSNLGIFTGFEDGTFRPDDTVTRAQMAAIVCRTLDLAEAGGGTVFNDVAADHWAAGYINTAQAQGIINGYGDGNFGPEDKVTYEQAIKMIVCALGYDLVAQAKGGYPTGYLSIASSDGITKNANGKVGDAAKRSTLAMLVYNSLEVRLLDQTTWTTDGSDEYSKSDDTILSKYLNVRKYEGIVTSTPFVDYAANGYDSKKTPEITINGYYTEYKDGVSTKMVDGSKLSSNSSANYEDKTADASLVDIGNLFGKKVVAYIGEDEDENTGNIMVYAISEKSNGNTVTSISSTQLVDSDDKEYTIGGQVSYRKTGATKVYDLDLDSDVEFYINYEKTTSLKSSSTTKDIDDKIANGGRIDLISNDNDDKIEIVSILAYDYEAVVKNVTVEDEIISFDTYKGDLDEIDTDSDDELVIVYKDGALAEAKDIEAEDTVSTVEVDKDVRILYASSQTVTGTVSSYDTDDETVTIAGNDYEISPFNKTSISSLANEEGTFYLNVDGQIAHNETDSTAAGNYGLILALAKDTGIDDNYYAQVAMQDGTVAEYDFSSKAKFYDKDGKQTATKDVDTVSKIAALTAGATTVGSSAVKTLVKNAGSSVFKFTFSNGEITKVKTLKGDSSSSYLTANSKKYDADSMTYGSASFDEDTIVFGLKEEYKSGDTTTIINSDDIQVGKISTFFADGDDEKTFISLDEDNSIYGVIVGFAFSATVPEDSEAVIITAKKTVTYNDDDATQITGIQGGKEVTYIIYDEDGDYTNADPDDLSKGDVILVSNADSDGVVSDFKLLYTANTKGVGTVSKTALAGKASDDIYNGVGVLNKDKTKDANSKFYIDSDIKNGEGTVWAYADDGITIKSNANYTLVDYTESTKNPTISKKSSSAVFSTISKYNTVVFVRVYDDKLTEVVAYRYNTVEVTKVSLNKPTATITVGNTETLTATVSPSNADATVTWTSSDEAVATVADGVVTAVAAGTATITATAGKKTATCKVTVTAE